MDIIPESLLQSDLKHIFHNMVLMTSRNKVSNQSIRNWDEKFILYKSYLTFAVFLLDIAHN